MGKVLIEKLGREPVEEQNIEIVERKGRGHPDYLADAASESLCQALCRYYNEKFGVILHHNVDKGLVVGGKSSPKFGGGQVDKPIEFIVAGRAVNEAKKGNEIIRIPIEELCSKSIREFLGRNFRFLNPEKDIKIASMVREGSVDLVGIFNSKRSVPLANDTSFGVSYAPLTQTEKLVFETERYLNSEKLKKELPEVGEDIKVMALRRKNKIELTISAAMISSLTPDRDHYISVKEDVCKRIESMAAKITEMPVGVMLNTGDNLRRGMFYLTVTGTSAERGDDGNTGRGNRANGLITPCRQMSLEATAGKNPINHVGKVYNALAKLTAQRITADVKGLKEVYVRILSQIGKPINNPQIVSIQTILEKGYAISNISADIKSIVDEEMAQIQKVTDLILSGQIELF